MESQPPSVAEPRPAAGLGALGLPTAPSASDFGRLVARWAEVGAALPVAVVVSVFDDLLAAAEGTSGLPTRARPLGLGDIMVDDAGVARLATPGPITVQELGELLRAALAGGSGDSAIPGAAHALLGRLRADAPSVEACDAEMVRVRLREALGPPAARHEVADCVRGGRRRARQLAAPPPLDFAGAVASAGGYGAPRDEEPVTALPTPPLAEDEDLPSATERPAPAPASEVAAPDLEDDDFVTERPSPSSMSAPAPGLPSVISARGVVESADARDPASGAPRPSSSPPVAAAPEPATDDVIAALVVPEPVTEAQSASDVAGPAPAPQEAAPQAASQEAAPPEAAPEAPAPLEAAPVEAEALETPPLDDEDDEALPVPPLLDEPLDPPIARSDPDEEPERPPSLLPRVRLPPKRRTPLTLPSAPQARVRPAAGEESDGSILMPSGYSRRVWGVLISVGLVIGALLYAFGYLD